MKIINQSHEIIDRTKNLLELIEAAGRTCYKSEDKISVGSAEKFVKMLIDRGHDAMLEMGYITVKFITNRGVTHELVRHRLCNFAQESSRYVNHNGRSMEFIKPVWCSDAILLGWNKDLYQGDRMWYEAMNEAEINYNYLIVNKWKPEQAREVLPNSLKTEIIVKANVREWRHILKLRCSKFAHPQMRDLMQGLLDELTDEFPVLFEDIQD